MSNLHSSFFSRSTYDTHVAVFESSAANRLKPVTRPIRGSSARNMNCSTGVANRTAGLGEARLGFKLLDRTAELFQF